MIERDKLKTLAGETVIAHYSGRNKEDCFVIGWLYCLDEDSIHLKITSTRFETYENVAVPLESIQKVEAHSMT